MLSTGKQSNKQGHQGVCSPATPSARIGCCRQSLSGGQVKWGQLGHSFRIHHNLHGQLPLNLNFSADYLTLQMLCCSIWQSQSHKTT